MKQNPIRPTPESHFSRSFVTFSAFFLGLSGLACCDNHNLSQATGDIITPHSEILLESGTRYMVFPPTLNPVRLYLIDTGISHKSDWFSRNSNLTFGASYTSLPQSTSTLHGTRMLDIIAGPESGAVSGTPIQVISLNIYAADGASTTVGLVADAIFEAIDREEQSGSPQVPAVICLASGSAVLETSAILEHAVDSAVEAGIPVIVSAGNSGQNASNYIPSKYGSKAGVVCAGAYGKNLQPLPMSNTGPAVDLVAPGEGVRTLSLPLAAPGTSQGMTGTSPATAIVTAAAIYQLSRNPQLSPAGLEEVLGSSVSTPAPKELDCRITPVEGEKFFDVSFVSCQLLTGNASSGFSGHSGDTVAVEWSDNLQTWTSGRFTDLGPPVEVPGGWRYTARSNCPVLSRNRLQDLVVVESAPRQITSIYINDTRVALPRAPYHLPLHASLLQGDLRAAGFSRAIVGANGAGFRIEVPGLDGTTSNQNSWVTWPGYISAYNPSTHALTISAGVTFKASYHLPDGTPTDLPAQLARLRTNDP